MKPNQALYTAIANLREREYPSLYQGKYTQNAKGPTPGPTDWDKAYAQRLHQELKTLGYTLTKKHPSEG